jgi:proteic killer suppression protein
MKIEFRDKRLGLVRTDRAAETKLPFAVIKACQQKFVVLEAAPDERTLWNWKSLRYEKLKGDMAGLRSVRVNDQWRIVFALDESTTPPTIVVHAIEDYH